ncbi:mannitol 1-phosphate dehydrogenase [Botrytis cinerea]
MYQVPDHFSRWTDLVVIGLRGYLTRFGTCHIRPVTRHRYWVLSVQKVQEFHQHSLSGFNWFCRFKNGAEITNPKLNVAIIGGGLGGLALSIGLLPYRDTLNITIYEAAPRFAEIGAGIASGPNAVNALDLISPDILRGYRKCATFNETRNHDNAWLTFRYGTEIRRRSCVHRARFLDEMAVLIPDGMARFKKSLVNVEDPEEDDEGLKLTFEDGETVFADVVIGCDGIKSATRNFVMGNQSIEPKFSNTYAYRAMVPRDVAREAIGDDLALNGQSYLGYGRYMISYPVEHGNLINFVALKTTKGVEWDKKNWLMPATKEEMASDLEGYEEKLVELVSKFSTGDKWGSFIFHILRNIFAEGYVLWETLLMQVHPT